jgi:16S rRNA (adenine1518-N6/adenine1519-N6)-dimethyltransferase
VTVPAPASLTPSALRALAERHGITPRKSLGQHFLVDAAMARRIVEIAAVRPGDRVVEVGAGLGSLTVVLAAAGAEVLAMEVDRRLVPPLEEVAGGHPGVRIVRADALQADWNALLGGERWAMVANLPYNVATPLVMRVLEEEPRIERMLVMVQREAGERLAATPGDEQYGAVSVRLAYRAEARVVRAIPRSVFWPVPNVDSVLVRIDRIPPPVDADPAVLFRVISVAFAQRRKTMRNALVRLGLDPSTAEAALGDAGVEPRVRPEELDLAAFGRVAGAVARAGTRDPGDRAAERGRG